MNLFLYLTNFIVPFLILAIIVYGLLMKINVYEHFIKGARNGFLTVLKIMPTLIGLMVSVGILRASGFLEMISSCIGQFTSHWISRRTGSSYGCQNVLFLSRYRTSSGSL